MRRLLGTIGLVLGLALVVGVGSASAASSSFTTVGCGNTVAANLFTVPSGVSSVQVVATGSAGETVDGGFVKGGSGDVVSGTLSGLTGGQVLDVCVNFGGGAAGASRDSSFNGGAGGGASGVALGSDFATPVLIAAGGGGGAAAGGITPGGSAGTPSGGFGTPTDGPSLASGGGGGGGTQSAFGAGGGGATFFCVVACPAGSNGAQFSSAGPGLGGAGGARGASIAPAGGGGGGAGYYGGGGGGTGVLAGGGGGGSDFCAGSLSAPVVLSGCGVSLTPNAVFGTASVTITYTVSNVCVGSGASFVSPASFQSGVPSLTSLSWCDAGAGSYYLVVGSSPGAGDLVSTGLPGSQTSFAAVLPAGRTLFATIYTYPLAGGGARVGDVVFATAPAAGQAIFVSPVSFQGGVPVSTTMAWSAPAGGAGSYYLTVGTSPGAGDVVSVGLPGSQTSVPVTLPAGRTLFATLWSYPAAGGGATATDVMFHTAYGATSFTNPTAFGIGVPASTTIGWTAAPGAGSYYLTVGTSPGAADVVNSGQLPGSQTSFAAMLAPGRTLYATVWSYPAAGGGPTPTDIVFSTSPGVSPARDLGSARRSHPKRSRARFERSLSVSMIPVGFARAGDPGGEFEGQAGNAFGEFHHWLDGPFKAGKLDPTKLDKQAADKAIASVGLIAQEAKLAKQAAAQDSTLAPLAALLQRIEDTILLIPADLRSDIPSTKTVELAAIQYINDRISEIEAAAKQAGKPIVEH